jgi:hypothetical protein
MTTAFAVVYGATGIAQGLKPHDICGLCGTTEVAPFQKILCETSFCGTTEVAPFQNEEYFRKLWRPAVQIPKAQPTGCAPGLALEEG